MPAARRYTIWTLPKGSWQDPLKDIDVSKISKEKLKGIEKTKEKYRKSIEERSKAFNTPIDLEQLDKMILPKKLYYQS